MEVHIFTKVKNIDGWKKEKNFSVISFHKFLIFPNMDFFQKMLNVSSEHSVHKNDISGPLAETDSDEATQRCSVRKVFLKLFFAKFIGKHLCWSLFLINFKLEVSSLKETPAQKFSCGFLQIPREHVSLQKHSR